MISAAITDWLDEQAGVWKPAGNATAQNPARLAVCTNGGDVLNIRSRFGRQRQPNLLLGYFGKLSPHHILVVTIA